MDRENKTNINWFPGHMAKTKRQITEDLKLVDIVIEILDARIPLSSQNPEINKIIQNKKRIIALNKSDLSDEKENQKWIQYFNKNKLYAVLIEANNGRGINDIIKLIQIMMKEEKEKLAEKGRIGKKTKVMIVGIPNVGKSSFINRITKKTSADVGNKPGVTKQKQWIRINNEIELLDTPGILWPKFESKEIALNLAYTGTIKDEILHIVDIAYYLIEFLIKNYMDNIEKRYNIEHSIIEKILLQEQSENENIYGIMQLIGKKRGALLSGGIIDDEKTAKIILDDFRSGRLGKITIDKCKI